MFQNVSRGMIKPGVVAIKAAASALARTTVPAVAFVDGTKIRIAAQDMPALTTAASLASGEKNVVVFVVNSAGTISALTGTKSTTANGVLWPVVAANQTVIGGVYIEAAATFTGGTTALDAASITFDFFDGSSTQPTFHV
jgi:hypothetical protein